MIKIDIYRSFEQWKNGNVLEHGVPRTEYYSEQELSLVEMGWKYGYDAGRAEQPAQQEPDRVKFERHWRKTRGDKKANRELPRHPLQPQTYIQDSANRHWVTWQAAVRSVAPQAQPAQQEPLFKPLIDLHPGLAEEMRAMDTPEQQENSNLFDSLIDEMLDHSYQGSHDSAEKVANEIRRMYKAAHGIAKGELK